MICCPFNRFNFEQYACGRSFPTKEAHFSHLILDHDWKPALWRLALYAAEYDVVEQGVAYISLLWKASWSPNGKRGATAPTHFCPDSKLGRLKKKEGRVVLAYSCGGTARVW